MSTIKIEFNLDNATFAGEDLGNSIADALDNLAGRIREANRKYLALPHQGFVVRDSNGNSIGRASLHEVDKDWEEAEDYISEMLLGYVVELLDGNSTTCNGSEHAEDLREALLQCVKDGDLTLEDVRSHCGD